MIIRDLFNKDIERTIEGVVTIGNETEEQKWQELEEYVCTDEIVKTAGISKGLLFHYFGSKIGVYAFLYDYATRFVTLELTGHVEKNENGYFELYEQILAAKVASMAQYPYIFLFLNKADEEDYLEAVDEISERREKYHRIMEALRERADVTKLTEKADYRKTWDVMDYTVQGLIDKNVKSESFRADIFMQEALEYIDMIREMSIEE